MKSMQTIISIAALAFSTSVMAAESAHGEREVWYDHQGNIVATDQAGSSPQTQPHDLAAAPLLTKPAAKPYFSHRPNSRFVSAPFYQMYPRWHYNSCHTYYHRGTPQPRFSVWYSQNSGWHITGRSSGICW